MGVLVGLDCGFWDGSQFMLLWLLGGIGIEGVCPGGAGQTTGARDKVGDLLSGFTSVQSNRLGFIFLDLGCLIFDFFIKTLRDIDAELP